jgi:hypothetical protein
MIQLICTHCKAMLEIDDGFAGGACRCQHCGTIQTVPSHLKQKAAAGKPSQTLYRSRPQNIGVPSSGLDQLADVIASSGLTSSRLRMTPEARLAFEPPQQKPQKSVQKVLIACVSIIVVLGGTVIYLVARGEHGPSAPANSPTALSKTIAAHVDAGISPSFCGIALEGDSIIYCLDRGDSARDTFTDLKSAVLRSIASLGPDRKFQIVFWNNGSDESYPSTWPCPAKPDNITAAERALERISPHGKSDAKNALKKSVASEPAEIVLVTAKAWDLDDTFVSTVDQIRKDKQIRIHTVSLGDPRASTALQIIAAKTHGTFKVCSESDLKEVVK